MLSTTTRSGAEFSSHRKCHSQNRTAGSTESPKTRLSTTNTETSAQAMRSKAAVVKLARRGIGFAEE